MKRVKGKKRAKVTSVEGLASLMLNEFADLRHEMNARFDRIEKRLEEADRRIAALEMKVAGLYRLWEEEKLQRLDVKHLFERIAKLEEKVYGR